MVKFNRLFNAILVLAFIIHISYIGYSIKYPETPSVRVYLRNLSDLMKFPVSFKLCAEEKINPTARYKKYGYENVVAFFQGRPDMYGNWFGWAGHRNGNETLGKVTGKRSTVFFVLKLNNFQMYYPI